MVSEAQIEANRKNAQLSTGPKNTENTKYNALKHSLTARRLINKKDEEQFQEIFENLCSQFEPKGYIQYILIDRMATCLWKIQKINGIQIADYNNKEVYAEQLINFDKMKHNTLFSLDNSVPLPVLSEGQEALQRYEGGAENGFYRALNKLIELKKLD